MTEPTTLIPVKELPAAQQGQAQPVGMPGVDLQSMMQAAWGQMEGIGNTQNAIPVAPLPPNPQAQTNAAWNAINNQNYQAQTANQVQGQSNVSLSAQVELELELSLRGSLLVQQQRRIVQLEDELQRSWSEIDRLRTKISSFERDRQRTDDDAQKQVSAMEKATSCKSFHPPLTPRSPFPSFLNSLDTGRPKNIDYSWRLFSALDGKTSSLLHSMLVLEHPHKFVRMLKSSSSANKRSRQVSCSLLRMADQILWGCQNSLDRRRWLARPSQCRKKVTNLQMLRRWRSQRRAIPKRDQRMVGCSAIEPRRIATQLEILRTS